MFHVAISPDFSSTARGLLDPVLVDRLDPLPSVRQVRLEGSIAEYQPQHLAGADALITLHPRVTADSLQGVDRLAVIARWGVGCNMIDLPACTAADIAVAITRDAVRRPVAEGLLTLLLGITHHLVLHDRLVRSGRWAEKSRYPGIGLQGRTAGLVGLGNIGAEFVRLLAPFGLGRILAHDPYAPPDRAAELNVHLVPLDELLEQSDFVCIICPLTDETFHLLAEPQLRRMKPTGFLINAARGPIVDQAALTRALRERWIAGAGLDVFEQEPIDPADPLLQLDNVILTPHAIAWTDALVRGNGEGACDNVLAVLQGQPPQYIANPQVLNRPGFRVKLDRLRRQWEQHAAKSA